MHARRAFVAVAVLGLGAAPAAADSKERPLPGFGGLTYRDVAVRDGCVPTIRIVHRSRKGDDPELVRFMTWPRITGLDFSPDDPAKARTSMGRFREWFDKLSEQGRKVADRQTAIARDATKPAVIRVEAAARLVVAEQQLIDLIQGIEGPASLRKIADAHQVYCDTLFETVEPLEARVTEIRGYCQKLIDDNHVERGWWTDVCALPAAATQPSTQPSTPPAPQPTTKPSTKP